MDYTCGSDKMSYPHQLVTLCNLWDHIVHAYHDVALSVIFYMHIMPSPCLSYRTCISCRRPVCHIVHAYHVVAIVHAYHVVALSVCHIVHAYHVVALSVSHIVSACHAYIILTCTFAIGAKCREMKPRLRASKPGPPDEGFGTG